MTDLRLAAAGDAASVFAIVEDTGMFSDDELIFMRGMVEADLRDADEKRRWIVARQDGDVVGCACLSPETFQPDVLNLLFLGVARQRRRAGIASALVARAAALAAADGARVLIVETSSDEAFGPARALYRTLGFCIDGRIRDYYAPGEDKVIFRRSL